MKITPENKAAAEDLREARACLSQVVAQYFKRPGRQRLLRMHRYHLRERKATMRFLETCKDAFQMVDT